MSKILDLAKSFEQTSSKQAKDTEQVVATEFKKHEQRLIDLLSENEKAMSNAIQEQNKRLLPTMLKTWSIVAIAVITAILVMWGILAYQSHKIGKNAEIIAQQNLAIQDLANKGGNIKLKDCIDNKDRKRLCVLVNKDAPTWQNGSLMVPMGY